MSDKAPVPPLSLPLQSSSSSFSSFTLSAKELDALVRAVKKKIAYTEATTRPPSSSSSSSSGRRGGSALRPPAISGAEIVD
jgi:hypothetical protein